MRRGLKNSGASLCQGTGLDLTSHSDNDNGAGLFLEMIGAVLLTPRLRRQSRVHRKKLSLIPGPITAVNLQKKALSLPVQYREKEVCTTRNAHQWYSSNVKQDFCGLIWAFRLLKPCGCEWADSHPRICHHSCEVEDSLPPAAEIVIQILL